MLKVQTTDRLCLSPEFVLEIIAGRTNRTDCRERTIVRADSRGKDEAFTCRTLCNEIANVDLVKINTNVNTLVELAKALYIL